MKQAIKIKFLISLALIPFAICAMQPGPFTPSHATTSAKTKQLNTPEKILALSALNNDTPVRTAERLIAATERSTRKRSLEQAYDKAAILLETAAPTASPNKKQRIKNTTSKAQASIVKRAQVGTNTSPTLYHNALTHKLQESSWLRRCFTKMAEISPTAAIHPIRVGHIFSGDSNGGCHFLQTPANVSAFTSSGLPIEHNYHTGVMGRSDNKTALTLVGSSIDEDVITDALQDIAQQPYIRSGQLALGITPQGIPLELVFKDGFVQTAYPLLSFTRWQPDQPALLVAPLKDTNGKDISIIQSSTDLVNIAQQVLYSGYQRALRYVDNTKLIVDLAAYFNGQGLSRNTCGIYVEFPLNQFDVSILQTNFPHLFQP